MKLEIIKETKFAEDNAWYSLYLDGSYIRGSTDLALIKRLYDKAKELKGDLKYVAQEVLVSEEI
jgi:hypothetical protein